MHAINNFWAFCLSQFEQELPAQQFNTWIRPLRLEGGDNPEDGLRLLAPNGFILKWTKERYLARIEELALTFFSSPVSVSLLVAENSAKQPLLEKRISSDTASAVKSTVVNMVTTEKNKKMSVEKLAFYEKTRLILNFTFENLIIGKANELARATAMQVARSPGDSTYNPLFVYGSTGLGKTHLMHAIGNYILQYSPQTIVHYVHAEDYYSDVVRAYQKKSFDSFKKYYRSLDVLLLDDVQFLNGKNRTQEELFFVFNTLIESYKQIVISCDTYPKDISGLDDRLITRFDWGLTVQIEPPETEMRVAILKKKAEIDKIILSDDVDYEIGRASCRERV